MSTPKFAETHNLVTFLEKPEESNGFEEIIDFLNTKSVQYALMVNPTIYTTCIEQFWTSAKAKIVNGERQIQALVDKKKVIITETSIRSDLKLDDAEGIDLLLLVYFNTASYHRFVNTDANGIDVWFLVKRRISRHRHVLIDKETAVEILVLLDLKGRISTAGYEFSTVSFILSTAYE
ncbi:hypothetical protein Tco_0367881 [Tanacetum coccineum]